LANRIEFPLLSIVMSTYMHSEYIEESIRSVWAQNYPNLEICIVDDCSSDNTFEILKRLKALAPFPMDIFRNLTNLELTATISRALLLAKGKYIAFLSGDDCYFPNRFEDQIDLMEKDPEMMVVVGNGRVFKGGEFLQQVHSDAVKSLLSKNPSEILTFLYTHPSPFFIQTLLVRRDFILSSGSFDQSMLSDDWVLNIRFFRRLVSSGKFAFIDKDFFRYRIHDTNVHKRFWRHNIQKLQVIWKYTPLSLKREGFSNIIYDIGLHCIYKQWKIAGNALYLFAQTINYDSSRHEKINSAKIHSQS